MMREPNWARANVDGLGQFKAVLETKLKEFDGEVNDTVDTFCFWLERP